MTKVIYLSNGKGEVIVDDDDFEYLNKHKWHRSVGYANRMITYVNDGIKKRMPLPMHREILRAENGQYVDHINGNPLDNRKCNLRICSHAENIRNRGLTKKNTSGYKGVYCSGLKSKPWRAIIEYDYKMIFIGFYHTAKDAAIAYNDAAVKYHGVFANLNKI